MTNEWIEWHRQYTEDGLLARRLSVVQDRIREALDRAPPGPIRVLSLCAGDGRDLIGVLADHPRTGDVRARLVELTSELAAAGREEAARHALSGVEFVTADASNTQAYVGAVPANVLLVCGIFGNITDEDVRGTIRHLPELCTPRATVVWTRGRFPPDLTPAIRRWFQESGFSELSFVPIPDTTASVGANQLVGEPRPFRPGLRLFTFLPKADRPSERAKRLPTKRRTLP